MRNGISIIGVVGSTNAIRQMGPEKAAHIIDLAHNVGKEITKARQIILTGGEPDSDRLPPIRNAAMNGAKEQSTKDHPARLISVLKRNPKFDVCFNEDSNPPYKHLLIKTTWGSERNFINGCVPDVVIAIHGGRGTLSEIAFANALGTPIVFLQIDGKLDTIAALNKVMEKELKRFQDILKVIHNKFPLFNIDKLEKETKTLLNKSPEIPLNVGDSCEKAVENAILLANQRMMSSFNNLPYHHDFIGKLDLYEKHLNSLMA
ncbi:hypothetical protein [Crocosphaera sp.]|uniref:SLOG cluster 4 domain-containing protein n=1 Tax=Crocosphaera sp. TaxID=2729996 RepID=UPI00260F926C|nr:hypothetical protein [Crocosphaera sp.]MDJ0582458.1 hypothetical protein [Crocosphaera sp.]